MLIVVILTFGCYWFLLEKAPFGLKVKAIREDESGAMSLGLNPTKIKLQSFLLSTVPAGLIGGIYAYWITYIDPASVLGDLVTDQAVVMAVFGGLGSLIGPTIGAVIIFAFKTVFWAYLSDYQVLYLIILGALIAASVVFPHNGLWGGITDRVAGRTALAKGFSMDRKTEKEAPHRQNLSGGQTVSGIDRSGKCRDCGPAPVSKKSQGRKTCLGDTGTDRLADRASFQASSLTLAGRKRLEVSKALALEPTLLLLDEVVAELNPTEADQTIGLILKLRDQGISILIVEHIMRVIMNISDQVVVLNFGRKIAAGKPHEVAKDPAVMQAYLGEGGE
jgi:branched-chain amino acid transport system permease protein